MSLTERLASVNQRIEALGLLPYETRDGAIAISLSTTRPLNEVTLDFLERQVTAAEQHRAECDAREAARNNPPPAQAEPTMQELLKQFGP